MRTSTSRKFYLTAAIAASSLVLAACSGSGGRENSNNVGADSCDDGITKTEVKIGGSSPLSGAAASYKVLVDSSKAYFDEVNAEGGVKMGDGVTRKINYLPTDDAYDPARTVKNVRKLIEEDKVFTMYQASGTSPIMAILEYTTQQGVPILFSITGSNDFPGLVKDGSLFATAMLPQFGFENSVMFKQMESINPKAKIAVLYANDAQGKGNLAELKQFTESNDLEVVAAESYEQTTPTVDSQVTTLKNSNADYLVLFATGTFVTQALKKASELKWTPEKFVVSASTDAATYLEPAGPGAAENLHSVTCFKMLEAMLPMMRPASRSGAISLNVTKTR